MIWILLLLYATIDAKSINQVQYEFVEPLDCHTTNFSNIEIEDANYGITYNLEISDLQSKNLAEIRELLYKKRLFTLQSTFSNNLCCPFDKNVETTTMVCDAVSCDFKNCKLSINQELVELFVVIGENNTFENELQTNRKFGCPKNDKENLLNVTIIFRTTEKSKLLNDIQTFKKWNTTKYYNKWQTTFKMSNLESKTMDQLREDLYELNLLTFYHRFFTKTNELLSPRSESEENACDFISCDEFGCYLYIGRPKRTQAQIDNSKYLRGLTINSNGEWHLSPLKIAEFIDFYDPDREQTTDGLEKVVNVTNSFTGYLRNKDGIAVTPIGIQESIQDPKFSEHSKISYITTRVLSKRIDIKLDYKKLIPSPDFVDDIYSIIGTKDTDVQKAQKLMPILNKYGWYIPLNYTLGKAVQNYYVCLDCANKDINSKIEEMLYELESIINQNGYINDWIPQSWEIVKYDDLIPSVMILREDYNIALAEIVRIFRQVHFDRSVKFQQPYINLLQYSNHVFGKISRVWV